MAKVKSVWLLGMRNNKYIELKGTPKPYRWTHGKVIDWKAKMGFICSTYTDFMCIMYLSLLGLVHRD